MKTSRQIRQEFIEFFQQRGHTVVPSSSLLPAHDPTLLFANAGMNQFKDVFLGGGSRPYTRAVNSQKCIRAGGKHNDLEDVGHDTYHHTFFEMLGNWSFGDYFKAEAIGWAWELLTKVWGLPKERLCATVFGGDSASRLAGDDESRALWIKLAGLPAERVLNGSLKDNFWEMGETGPCGPCTEIHYDFGEGQCDGAGHPGKSCAVNVSGCSRFIEIWNLVFIQFNRTEKGSLEPLPARHVDTGMGFERICRALQDVASNYDTDVFAPLISWLEGKSGVKYGMSTDTDVAIRVIADHARSCTFAIADGVLPSNEGRGYVIRRILRRAARFGRKLGLHEPFLHEMVPVLVEQMGEVFPELKTRCGQVAQTILQEEISFNKNLDRGIELFRQRVALALEQAVTRTHPAWKVRRNVPAPPYEFAVLISDPEKKGLRQIRFDYIFDDIQGLGIELPQIDGATAFELYATYGFPVDLTAIMAAEQGLTIDMAGYHAEMEKHKQISSAGGGTFQAAAVTGLPKTDDSAKYHTGPTNATVLGWVIGEEFIRQGTLQAGQEAALVLDHTNFYGESGGQVGDSGTLSGAHGHFTVKHAKLAGHCVLHLGVVDKGHVAVGDVITAKVGPARLDIMRNHTATHLLNWALRKVLGEGVEQGGSVVEPTRLRFDFTHGQAMTDAQTLQAERLVNERVLADEPLHVNVLPLATARQIQGVRAVFGEKYPDPVRVVSVGTADPVHSITESTAVEFCGGTHLDRTGKIGLFKIVSEESVARGTRRITAVTGHEAVRHVEKFDEVVRLAGSALRVPPEKIVERIEAMQAEIKKLRKQPVTSGGAGAEQAVETPAGKAVIINMPTADPAAMRNICDQQRQKGAVAVLVGGADGEKVTLVAMVTDELAKKVKAGDWVKAVAAIVGGSGGGKPTLAQAGGKDPSKLPEALEAGKAWIMDKLT